MSSSLCAAGGITVYVQADNVRAMLPSSVDFVAMADAGLVLTSNCKMDTRWFDQRRRSEVKSRGAQEVHVIN